METFQHIYQDGDFYVPAFDIKIRGMDLPKAARSDVLEVRYCDSVDQFDTFEVTINNWDAETQDFKYTGPEKAPEDPRSRLFDPEQIIELWMGYYKPVAGNTNPGQPDPLRLMLAGKINKLAPSFPASGQPTLKVSGKSVLSELSKKQETHHYGPNITASEIAKKVEARGNLKLGNLNVPLEIDDSARSQEPPLEYMLQDNQYDIVFLLQLAHRHGYDLVLKDKGRNGQPKYSLYFGPSTMEERVSYVVQWGRSLIQFQPTLTTANQVNEVVVRGWNALKKQKIEVKATRDQLESRPLRDRQRLRRLEDGFKEKKEIIVDRPFRNEHEAKLFAKDRLKRLADDTVTARGSTLGTPALRAGSKIEVRGLGSTFSGRYSVKSTAHSIGAGGYLTEFAAKKEEKD